MDERTVLILGAGASQPYGLPLGWQLRDMVIELAQHREIHELCDNLDFKPREYSHFTGALATSGEKSVDAFLERVPGLTKIGKLGIAYCLCSMEMPHRLFPPNQPKNDHWLESLWGLIRQDSWRKQRALPLTIVTFNYDRLVEHYLATVMASTFSVRRQVIEEYVTSTLCVHVHGSLGRYRNDTFDSGINLSLSDSAVSGALGIRIIHEEDAVTSEFEQARAKLKEAERIFLLGFGFHKTNLHRLGIKELCESRRPLVLGTHKGIKAKAWSQICAENRFSYSASRYGSGSISNFLNEAFRIHSRTMRIGF